MAATTVMTLATVSAANPSSPWISNSFFAHDDAFDLFWVSEPGAEHSLNLEANASAAVSIYDPDATAAGEKLAVQLFGRAEPVAEPALMDAVAIYAGRFERFAALATSPAALRDLGMWMYRFSIERLKLFDEARFGRETRVEASVVSPG